ncbi:MAG: hypothetical protein K6F54_08620 [Lachnospiraceae bacterium]|nr:hypothetical protein [Lachnospiraceae bacterium]
MMITGSKQTMNLQGSMTTARTMRYTDYSHVKEQKDKEGGGRMVRYDQISKDGDTLELSSPKISDALLRGYSDVKLKQLYNNKEISKQQYDKAVKSKEDI